MKYNNLPFNYLPTLKQKACYILYLAGFSYKEIVSIGVANNETISKAIKNGIKQYNILRRSKNNYK